MQGNMVSVVAMPADHSAPSLAHALGGLGAQVLLLVQDGIAWSPVLTSVCVMYSL
jgi:hypothetical protein